MNLKDRPLEQLVISFVKYCGIPPDIRPQTGVNPILPGLFFEFLGRGGGGRRHKVPHL